MAKFPILQPAKALLAYLLAFVFGQLICLSFAPWQYFFLSWLVLAGLFQLLNTRVQARHAFICTLSFAAGMFLTGVSWIYVSLANIGGLPVLLAAMFTFIFCLFLALFPAVAGYGYWRLVRSLQLGKWQQIFVFAGCFTLAELLRGYIFTGFPWLAIGYGQMSNSPLIYFAPFLGVYGVSFVTYIFAAGLAIFVQSKKISIAAFLVSLLIVGQTCSYITWAKPSGEPVSVALLQGNIAQEDKWRSNQVQIILKQYWQLIKDNPAQLTILPETALPFFYQQLPDYYRQEIEELAAQQNGHIIIGLPYGNMFNYWNSLVSFGVGQRQIYAKQHLVPFGEFVPFGFGWFAAMTSIPFSNFQRGNFNKIFQINGQKFAMTICYEDVFGEELVAAFPSANFIINSSNTAWFGDSLAQYQHLQIAQMRSLEMARPSIRATNTGMTAVIDINGKITAQLEKFTTGVLKASVQGYSGITPYMYFSNYAIILIILFCFAAICFNVKSKRQNAIMNS